MNDSDEFVSEPIEPRPGRFDAAAMARGEPGLPADFTWRGRPYTVGRLLATWKTSGLDAGDLYLRRHWYRIQTTTGEQMVLYCERHPRNRGKPKARWWLYTIRR
ncbi:MAG: cytoplasmic protein [Planctomycetes bacterium]|nr:cytoplasmic protein [Planctomycetota bacterium]